VAGADLFDSGTKYDSSSGRPAFSSPMDWAAIAEETDVSHGMISTRSCAPWGPLVDAPPCSVETRRQ